MRTKSTSMQVSIKVVFGIFIILVSLFAMAFAIIPSVYHLHDDVMHIVLGAATRAADQAQYILERKLRVVSNFADAIANAFKSHNLIDRLQPWPVVSWAGATVLKEQIGVNIWRNDDHGCILTHYDSIFGLAPPMQNFVYIYNLTNPGSQLVSGYFNVETYAPANESSPWRVGVTGEKIRMSAQPNGIKVMQPNRSDQMMWLGVAPMILPTNRSLGLLAYGAPLRVVGGSNPSDRIYLVVTLRGNSLSSYMRNVSVTSMGAMVLYDVVTSTFVAGNIGDPNSRPTSDGSTAELIPIYDLKDVRIRQVLSATVEGQRRYAPNWTGERAMGADAVTQCTAPCTFVYWPHSNTLQDGLPRPSAFNLNILWQTFTVVRVIEVHTISQGARIPATSSKVVTSLALRLIVTVPSDEIVGRLIYAYQWGVLWSVIFAIGLAIVSLVVVKISFSSLAVVETQLLCVVATFLLTPPTATPCDAHTNSFEANLHSCSARWFLEVHRILISVRRFARAISMLRAFVPIAAPVVIVPTSSLPQQVFTGTLVGNSSLIAPHFEYLGAYSSARSASRGGIWSVPVTSLHVILENHVLDDADPLVVVQRHSAVLATLQRHIKGIPGAVLDSFYGYRFYLHFNACARTPKHVLTAVSVALRCLAEVPVGVSFGIATNLSFCGFLGPSAMKTFTIVSHCPPQATLMARLAPSCPTAILMTWRAAEVALQERVNAPKYGPLQEALASTLVPAVNVVLPGETCGEATCAFAIRAK